MLNKSSLLLYMDRLNINFVIASLPHDMYIPSHSYLWIKYIKLKSLNVCFYTERYLGYFSWSFASSMSDRPTFLLFDRSTVKEKLNFPCLLSAFPLFPRNADDADIDIYEHDLSINLSRRSYLIEMWSCQYVSIVAKYYYGWDVLKIYTF